MSERRMIEPAAPGRAAPWRRGSRRRIVVATVAMLAVGLFGAVSVAAGSVPARPPAVAQAPTPGVDTAVQRWFKAREPFQIELNNALAQAKNLPRQPGAATPVCARLAGASRALAALSKVPFAPLDAPLRAGLDKFQQGAAACLRGDLAGAEQLVAQGLAERPAAQDQIDAILDGD